MVLIRLFGPARSKVGLDEVIFDLPPEVKLLDLTLCLIRKFENLSKEIWDSENRRLKSSYAFAVDRRYVGNRLEQRLRRRSRVLLLFVGPGD